MGTAARKARKRSGEKFIRTPKVGTPVEDRAENQPRGHYLPNFKVSYERTAKAKRRLAEHAKLQSLKTEEA